MCVCVWVVKVGIWWSDDSFALTFPSFLLFSSLLIKIYSFIRPPPFYIYSHRHLFVEKGILYSVGIHPNSLKSLKCDYIFFYILVERIDVKRIATANSTCRTLCEWVCVSVCANWSKIVCGEMLFLFSVDTQLKVGGGEWIFAGICCLMFLVYSTFPIGYISVHFRMCATWWFTKAKKNAHKNRITETFRLFTTFLGYWFFIFLFFYRFFICFPWFLLFAWLDFLSIGFFFQRICQRFGCLISLTADMKLSATILMNEAEARVTSAAASVVAETTENMKT